jgi:pantoate--beta-alanine ligase
MRSIETLAELRHQVHSAKGRGERVGFVPTMGALHEGHQALIRVAHAQCDFVVVSAYVNPTQFAPGEDFDLYPRTPQQDAELAGSAGADLLWRPLDTELYPDGAETRVTVGKDGDRLCGTYRAGHFTGVATIVVKLLGAVEPDVLYLGEKDYQQAILMRRVVRDLLMPVEVRLVPTVRDPDGLALSSRNRYLEAEERNVALAIPRALDAVGAAVEDGERSVGRLRARADVTLGEYPSLEVDYVEIVDPDTLEAVDHLDEAAIMLIAAQVGSTRLIDNRRLEPAPVKVAP